MARGGRPITQHWKPNPTAQTRRERVAGTYQAYVPDPIADVDPQLASSLVAEITEADAAVHELNQLETVQANRLEALARQLLRQESLASSRIEGLRLSHRRLAHAAYDPRGNDDEMAKAVLANIEAMDEAIRFGASKKPITTATIVKLHKTLLESTKPEVAGKIREQQNWVGGSYHTPVGAEFVPPPANKVKPLLDDLALFMRRDDIPVTLQAAVAHAQFETIHPFADGNGRVGRCLIHVIYRRRRLAPHHVPPISLLMATDTKAYVKALTAYRGQGWEEWSRYFAETTKTSTTAAEDFAERLNKLQEKWRKQANVRAGSTAARLIDILPVQPLMDVQTAARLVGVSEEAARLALNTLNERGVVKLPTSRKWARVWEAQGLYDLLDRFEQRLATSSATGRLNRPAPKTR